ARLYRGRELRIDVLHHVCGERCLVRGVEVTRRDDLVRVDVRAGEHACPAAQRRGRGTHCRNSLGSVMRPVTAVAAAVAGEARYTSAPGWPMRPVKLRFVVERQRSPFASTPMCPPRHAPQVGVE